MTKTTLDAILHNPKIPTLPAVAVRVLELTRSTSSNIREVAEIIENDQALAVKIIRTVNSSYYGLARPCGTIHQAIIYLGLEAVKSLVLGFSLVDSVQGDGEDDVSFNFADYWRRELASAAAAREVAVRSDVCDPEEAFLAALVQDVGMIALNRAFKDVYLQALDLTGGDHHQLARIERQSFEMDHAEVGAALSDRWTLPPNIVAAVRFHHDSRNAPPEHLDFVRVVELAGMIATLVKPDSADTALPRVTKRAHEWFNIERDNIASIIEAVRDASTELAKLFRVNIGKPIDIDNLLDEAEQTRIEREVSAFGVVSGSDGPSRAANPSPRADVAVIEQTSLAEAVNLMLRQSAKAEAPCALILCEAGTPGTDQAGAAGDGVGNLPGGKIENTVRSIIGPSVTFHTIGPNQLAILVPQADRVIASRLAETIRRELIREEHEIVRKAPSMQTISIGVGAYEPGLREIVGSGATLLAVAEQALSLANAAGRNCVRVYNPATNDQRAA